MNAYSPDLPDTYDDFDHFAERDLPADYDVATDLTVDATTDTPSIAQAAAAAHGMAALAEAVNEAMSPSTPSTPVLRRKADHVKVVDGDPTLRAPFTRDDYVRAGVRGDQVEKMLDSHIAPLVAAAAGFRTITARNWGSAESYYSLLPRTASPMYQRLADGVIDTTHVDEPGDVLVMPWYSLTDVIRFDLGKTDALEPACRQWRSSMPGPDPDTGIPNKYEFESGKRTPIGVHPSTPERVIENAATVLIAEGMLKGYAALTAYLAAQDHIGWEGLTSWTGAPAREHLRSLIESCEDAPLILIIGGIHNWGSQNAWNTVAFKGRRVLIGVDGDVTINAAVHQGTSGLWDLVKRKGGRPGLLAPTVTGDAKAGIDDYLARHGGWSDLLAHAKDTLTTAPPKKPTVAERAREAARSVYVKPTTRGMKDVPDPSVCVETANSAEYPLTYVGLGQRLLRHFGDRIAWCPAIRAFRIHVGTHWAVDRDEVLINSMAFRVMRSITTHEAGHVEDSNAEVKVHQAQAEKYVEAGLPIPADLAMRITAARKAARAEHVKFGARCEDTGAALTRAKQFLQEQLTAPVTQWDRHTLLVNGLNGTYHVGKRVLREHRPEDYITRILACEIDLDATSEDVESMLAHLDAQTHRYREHMLRWAGGSLTGMTDMKAFMAIVGIGDAGKSTMAEGLYAAAGGAADSAYGYKISAKAFSVQQTNSGSGHSDALDKLAGRTFAIADEAEHVQLDVDLIKDMSAGGTQTTSAKGGTTRSWLSELSLWFIGNGRFRFTGHDMAVLDRMMPVSFDAKVARKDQQFLHRIKTRPENHRALIAAVLIAASDFYEEYQQNRLDGDTDAARNALHPASNTADLLEEYASENNPLSTFLEAKATVGDEASLDHEGRMDNPSWLAYYNESHQRLGLNRLTPTEFNKYMGALGHPLTKGATEFVAKMPGGSVVRAPKKKYREGIRVASRADWLRLMADHIEHSHGDPEER